LLEKVHSFVDIVEVGTCNILCVHTATDAPEAGGQAFQNVKLLRTHVSRAQIAVAGGISIRSAKGACESGADILVVGSAILKARDEREAARALH
jgi:3-hexulose-6-phosphate synthase